MNFFQVILVTEAQADIKRLNPAIQTRILDKLEWYLFNKVGQDLGHKPVILNRSAAEVKNLALDRRFGHCNVRFFASLRFAQNDTPKY